MLLNFTLENWMSYRDRVEFSMLAGSKRLHGKRVPRVRRYQARVLPVALVFGGNASGKTNFCAALHFARNLVVQDTRPEGLIPVEGFQLAPQDRAAPPTRFAFEILCGDDLYEYSFAATPRTLVEERLVLHANAEERQLYHRRGARHGLHPSLESREELLFACKETRLNQLFLTCSVARGLDQFRPVYDWFAQTLDLRAADDRFGDAQPFFAKGHGLFAKVNRMLTQLDTGVLRLAAEEVPFESLPLSDSRKLRLQRDVMDGQARLIRAGQEGRRYALSRKDGRLLCEEILACRAREGGAPIRWGMHRESDGARRLLDLLPPLLELIEQRRPGVLVVDEFDRNLHPAASRALLEAYLRSSSESARSQLLLTAQDAHLMDQDLLRRDEIWLAERDRAGVSDLYSADDLDEADGEREMRSSYLQGKFGGVPRVALARRPPARGT